MNSDLYKLNKDELILLISTIQEETKKEEKDKYLRLFEHLVHSINRCVKCQEFIVIGVKESSFYSREDLKNIDRCDFCFNRFCNLCDVLFRVFCHKCKYLKGSACEKCFKVLAEKEKECYACSK